MIVPSWQAGFSGPKDANGFNQRQGATGAGSLLFNSEQQGDKPTKLEDRKDPHKTRVHSLACPGRTRVCSNMVIYWEAFAEGWWHYHESGRVNTDPGNKSSTVFWRGGCVVRCGNCLFKEGFLKHSAAKEIFKTQINGLLLHLKEKTNSCPWPPRAPRICFLPVSLISSYTASSLILYLLAMLAFFWILQHSKHILPQGLWICCSVVSHAKTWQNSLTFLICKIGIKLTPWSCWDRSGTWWM